MVGRVDFRLFRYLNVYFLPFKFLVNDLFQFPLNIVLYELFTFFFEVWKNNLSSSKLGEIQHRPVLISWKIK